MKKKFLFVFLFLLTIFIPNVKAQEKNPTLQEISDRYNEQSAVNEYKKKGFILNSYIEGGKLYVDCINENINVKNNYIYEMENNIISNYIIKENDLTIYVVSAILIDTISQFHGYNENEIIPMLSADELSNYTIEKEGFEVYEESKNNIRFKIDVSKKIPPVDLSKVYIKPDNLRGDTEKYIKGSGFVNLSKGNVAFHKNGDENYAVVYILELNNLTNASYQSLLSVIEVMFDKNTSAFFQKKYPKISGNNSFSGFNIFVDKTLQEEDLDIYNDKYKLIKIEIDKNKVINDVNSEIINPNTGINPFFRFLPLILLLSFGITLFYSKKLL